MPTLEAYAAELFQRYGVGPDGRPVFGVQYPITSLAVKSIVSNQLLYGGVGPGKFSECWYWRPDTASAADRVRLGTSFTSATGTLIHAGTDYADTTATGESVFICNPEWEPENIAKAIDLTIRSLRHYDRTPIPTKRGDQTYWLSDFAWLKQPSDIVKITQTNRPQIGRNPSFEKWSMGTGGIVTPDDWTLAGAAATMARSTTQNRQGQYTVAITRAGTNCTLLQTPGLLDNGVSSNNGLIGETLTVWGRVYATVATQARLTVLDGTQTLYSSYHTGGSAIEALSKSITVAAAATTLQFGIAVESDNAVVYVDKLRLLRTSSVDDTMINDAYDLNEMTLDRDSYKFDQGVLRFFASSPGLGRQWIIHSNRPYSAFDQTRLNAGTADLDVSDAPLETVAIGTAWRLFKGRYGEDDQRTRDARDAYQTLALRHLYREPSQTSGLNLLPTRLAVGARRQP